MSTRRFESEERWRELTLEGAALTLATGTPSTRGVARTTVFPTPEEARARAEEKTRGYLAAGYLELDAATFEARRASLGAPMDLGTTTPAAEAASEAKRAAVLQARAARRPEKEPEPLDEDPSASLPLPTMSLDAPSLPNRWPAAPRVFVRIASGERWEIVAHQGVVYESSYAGRIRTHPFPSDERARAEVAARIEAKTARGWVPHVGGEASSFAARRPPRFLGASAAFARVRRAFLRGTDAMARAGSVWRERERDRHRAVLERFRGTDETPALLSPAEEGVALVMLERAGWGADATGLTARAREPSPLPALLDFWVASKDAAFAVEALLSTTHLGVHHENTGRGRTRTVFPIALATDAAARVSAWLALRAHLRCAPSSVRDAATARMRSAFTHGEPALRCMLALAFPSERSLVAVVIDEHLALPELPARATWLVASAFDAAQARALIERLSPSELLVAAPHLEDLVDAAGAAACDALVLALQRASERPLGTPGPERLERLGDVRRAAARALGRLDDPRTTQWLERGLDEGVLDPDLWPGLVRSALSAPQRFVDRIAPAAAAGGTTGAIALALLTWMLRVDPELAPKAPGTGARRAMQIALGRARGVVREPADSSAIPLALRPSLEAGARWRGKPAASPPPLTLAPLARESHERWPPGLREAWRDGACVEEDDEESAAERDARCEEAFDRARESGAGCPIALLLEASAPIALAAWQEIEPGRWRGRSAAILAAFVARHGLLAVDGLTRFGEARPFDAAPLLLPFASPELAGVAAACLADEVTRRHARAFLNAHPQAAAIGLLPRALGALGTARTQAEQALHELGALGHAATVRALASSLDGEVVARVERLLAHDPRREPPLAPWSLPDCWDARTLSAPILHATGRALDPAALEALGELLVIDATEERPEIDDVKAACDPASLAELACDVTLSWMASGAVLTDAGILGAVGHFGGDDAVRLIADLVRRADDDGDVARARMLIDVLADRGSELAVLHLVVLSRRARERAIRATATSALSRVARERDVRMEQLAEASVPLFGLGSDGSLELDFGGAGDHRRRFRVGFDEQLAPFVLDAHGTRLTHLPPIEPTDDPERVLDAETSWRRIKHEVGALAITTVERLEEAMVAQRAIPLADFDAFYRRHPLVRHIARRVLWQTASEAPPRVFRVAEDDTLSDASDALFDLREATSVRVAHPLHLDAAELAAWRSTFADYQLLQPFPQIDRPTHAVDPTLGDGVSLPGLSGIPLSPEAIARLKRDGFEPIVGAGFERRPPESERALAIHVRGFGRPGSPTVIERVCFRAPEDATPTPLRRVDPVERSEAVLRVHRLLHEDS